MMIPMKKVQPLLCCKCSLGATCRLESAGYEDNQYRRSSASVWCASQARQRQQAAMSVPEHQNGALPRAAPLPDIQENEPLNAAPFEVKVTIRENPIQEKAASSSTKSTATQKKEKKRRTQLERFLITTCILLSSCVVILLLLLMVQAYFSGKLFPS